DRPASPRRLHPGRNRRVHGAGGRGRARHSAENGVFALARGPGRIQDRSRGAPGERTARGDSMSAPEPPLPDAARRILEAERERGGGPESVKDHVRRGIFSAGSAGAAGAGPGGGAVKARTAPAGLGRLGALGAIGAAGLVAGALLHATLAPPRVVV